MKKNLTVIITLCTIFCICLGVYQCRINVIEDIAEKKSDTQSRVFGATYMTRNNPFFEVLHEGIKEVVEANGDILIARDPQQNQERQNQQIEDMINEGIEILFLNPVDWEDVEPALEACREANVPVINVDTAVKNTQGIISIIETDNYQAGVECAIDMMKRVSSAQIVVIDNPIQQSIMNRIQGFTDTIEGNDKYEIIYQEKGDGEIEISAEVMREFLRTGVKFNVVLGGNDPTALGILAALQQHKEDSGVLIYGIDGSPDFKAMIELGYVTGTSTQSPASIGRLAAQTAYKYLDGEEVDKHIKLPSNIITKENLQEYEINGWQ